MLASSSHWTLGGAGGSTEWPLFRMVLDVAQVEPGSAAPAGARVTWSAQSLRSRGVRPRKCSRSPAAGSVSEFLFSSRPHGGGPLPVTTPTARRTCCTTCIEIEGEAGAGGKALSKATAWCQRSSGENSHGWCVMCVALTSWVSRSRNQTPLDVLHYGLRKRLMKVIYSRVSVLAC